jgi:hypothetical protein
MPHSPTQQEADALMRLEKHCDPAQTYDFPGLGGHLRIPMLSGDRRAEFTLDVQRGSIALGKNTYQTRTMTAVVLARLDIGGGPHRNPDGAEVPCPHVHTYREGYGDRWAHPLPDGAGGASDYWGLLSWFMDICNVATRPNIARGLFQ